MNKITSLLLALVMALALAVPAFAAGIEIEPAGKNGSQDVTAKYTAPKNDYGQKVYYFTVAWAPGTHDLAYEGKDATYTWDGETMKYKETINNADQTKIGWTGTASYTVNVANQSNGTVNVSTDATVKYNLTLTAPEVKTATLTTAAVKNGQDITAENGNISETGTAQPASFEYTYAANSTAGTPDAPTDGANTVTVGTITVTVTHA